MKKGYSLDLRKRVVDAVLLRNQGIRETAEIYQVHQETVRNWVNLFREKGVLKIDYVSIYKPRKLNVEALRKEVEENPESYLSERAEKFGVVTSTICKALKRMGITYKKKH